MKEISRFSTFSKKTRPALKKQLKVTITSSVDHGTPALQEMITYQLGWTGENAGPKAEGKLIRPLLVLLAAEAAGGEWQSALPVAAAVELIHNFSLIHVVIEDYGTIRRGRPTVWKVWGAAQAINTGDAMFALANLSLMDLEESLSADTALDVSKLFHTTCLRLTQGQHLDILFEDLDIVSLEEYWQMVSGKTAALLAFSLEAGALCGEIPQENQANYRNFGHYLGLAFQAQDDILGIWGNQDHIGKSNTGDLVTGKKTLPILFGLAQKKEFYKRWTEGSITSEEAGNLSVILEAEGGRAYAQNTADQLTNLALAALDNAQPRGESGKILRELANKLLNRKE